MPSKFAVKDFMSTELVSINENANVLAAIKLLLQNKISGAPVVNNAGELVGVISEIDCMKTLVESTYHNDLGALVSELMTKNVETVPSHMSIVELAAKFIKERYRRYPVVEDGELIGQISRRDVLRAIAKIN